mgnify:CR=1 FL=1
MHIAYFTNFYLPVVSGVQKFQSLRDDAEQPRSGDPRRGKLAELEPGMVGKEPDELNAANDG